MHHRLSTFGVLLLTVLSTAALVLLSSKDVGAQHDVEFVQHYESASADMSPSGTAVKAVATCPGAWNGHRAVSSEWFSSSGRTFQSFPKDDGTGWEVEQKPGAGSDRVTVTAHCSSVASDPRFGYEVVSSQPLTVPDLHYGRVEARCSSGKRVISGGVVASNLNAGVLSQSMPSDDGRGWLVEWRSEAGSSDIVAKATCGIIPENFSSAGPSGYTIATRSETVAAGWSEDVHSPCPDERIAIGGGLASSERDVGGLVASYRRDGWTVKWQNFSPIGRDVATKAICIYYRPYNELPQVSIAGADVVAEDASGTTTYSASVTDHENDDMSYEWDVTGGGASIVGSASQELVNVRFPDGPAEAELTLTVTQRSTDESVTDSLDVKITNRAPVVTVTPKPSDFNSGYIPEGEQGEVTYTVTDPGNDTITVTEESCGSQATRVNTAQANHFECLFLDGTMTTKVSVEATDGDLLSGFYSRGFSHTITVVNIVPTITLEPGGPLNAAGNPVVDEGGTVTFAYSIEDPGDDTFTPTESCGSAANYNDLATDKTFSCTFLQGPTSGVVTVSVVDDGYRVEKTVSVDVKNVAPSVQISGANVANEGDTIDYTYVATDVAADPLNVTEACGVGGTHITTVAPNHFSCLFTDGPATPDVSVTATDPNDATASSFVSVNVANVAPKLDLSGSAQADEGETVLFTYSVVDPGNDVLTLDEACGWEGIKGNTATEDHFSCTFNDGPATSLAKAKATDDDGATGNDSIAVEIKNVAPSIVLTGPSSSKEGATESFTYLVVDPGADTFTFDENCDAAGRFVGSSDAGHFSCEFPDGPASSRVRASVTDDDSGSAHDVIEVSIENVAPKIQLRGAAGVQEGEDAVYTYTVRDSGDDEITITETCGNKAAMNAETASNSFSCRFLDGPSTSKVGLSSNDGDAGGSSTETIDVVIINQAPIASAGGPYSADWGRPIHFDARGSTDLGANGDSISYQWDFNHDGSFTPDASGATPSHTYPSPGVYIAAVRVTDKDHSSSVATTRVAVAKRTPRVVYTGEAVGKLGEDLRVSAVVTDPYQGTPLAGTAVTFALGPNKVTALTGANGSADAMLPLAAPAGHRTVSVQVDERDLYQRTEQSANVDVVPHSATVAYTGDSIGGTGTSLLLQATVTDTSLASSRAAKGSEAVGTIGDPSGEWVVFEIRTGSGCSTPVLDVIAPVEPGAVVGDGTGVASKRIDPLPPGEYCIALRLAMDDAGTPSANYATQTIQPHEVVSYEPARASMEGTGSLRNGVDFRFAADQLSAKRLEGALVYRDRLRFNGHRARLHASTSELGAFYPKPVGGTVSAQIEAPCSVRIKSAKTGRLLFEDLESRCSLVAEDRGRNRDRLGFTARSADGLVLVDRVLSQLSEGAIEAD